MVEAATLGTLAPSAEPRVPPETLARQLIRTFPFSLEAP